MYLTNTVCDGRHKVNTSVVRKHPTHVLVVVCDCGGDVDDGKGASGGVEHTDAVCVERREVDDAK